MSSKYRVSLVVADLRCFYRIERSRPAIAFVRARLRRLRMVTVREPVLHSIPIAELRPTQMTVGMREVRAKQKSWQDFVALISRITGIEHA